LLKEQGTIRFLLLFLINNPELAAKLCNEVVKTGDKVKSYILKQNLIQAVNTMQQNMMATTRELESMGEEMQGINKNIVFNYNTLAKQKYAERIKAQIELRDYISKYRNDKNGELLELMLQYEDKISRDSYSLKDSYDPSDSIVKYKKLPMLISLHPAQVPDKKYCPQKEL
jgi:hypothetical protein